MNVLVTGGQGFIGQAVQRELATRGCGCVLFDRPDDIRDAAAVVAAMAGCDAVIHLAGMLGTHELFDRAAEAVDVNIVGTLSVLDACVKHSARYVGITMPRVFPSIYTATKIGAAALEDAYAHNYGLKVSKVRAFNAFGPGQKYGDDHPQKIIPTFATKAWHGEPLPVWGDGTQTVDLIHVDQIARMLVDAVHLAPGTTFDAGTGTAFTVNEVAEFVIALTGSSGGVEHLPMRRGEVPTWICADGMGWEHLVWRPEFRWRDLAATVRAYGPSPALPDPVPDTGAELDRYVHSNIA